MQVLFDFTIRVFLTQDEFKLIGRALSGKLKGRELEDALDLNRRLLAARLVEHETQIDLTKRAMS